MNGASGKARFETGGTMANQEGLVAGSSGTSFKTFQRFGRSNYPALASRGDCGPPSAELISDWVDLCKQISEGLEQ
jgi:hypothetical protein